MDSTKLKEPGFLAGVGGGEEKGEVESGMEWAKSLPWGADFVRKIGIPL